MVGQRVRRASVAHDQPKVRVSEIEEDYPRAYGSVSEARVLLGRHIDGFYNARRPHSNLDWQAPDDPEGIVRSTHFNVLPSTSMAA